MTLGYLMRRVADLEAQVAELQHAPFREREPTDLAELWAAINACRADQSRLWTFADSLAQDSSAERAHLTKHLNLIEEKVDRQQDKILPLFYKVFHQHAEFEAELSRIFGGAKR